MSLLYAVRILPAAGRAARLPRAQQSTAAAALAQTLQTALGRAEGAPRLVSRSHSRALVAAAIAIPSCTALGIDIEHEADRHGLPAIAAHLLGQTPPAMSLRAFYQLWTFGEAYFKAFGRDPTPVLLARVLAAHQPAGRAWMIEEDVWIMHRSPCRGFVLGLVWGGAAAEGAAGWPRYLPP